MGEPSRRADRADDAWRVAAGVVTYAVAAVLQRAVPLLLLPVFTRILSPTEFGEVGILTTIAAAATVLVGLGLESAVFRGYLRSGGREEGSRFVTTVGGFVVAAAVAVSLLGSAFLAAPLSELLGVPVDGVRFAIVGAALVSTSTLVPQAILRAEERLGDYLQLTGLQVIVTPLLTIAFVAWFDLGSVGWMLAYMLSGGVLLIRGVLMIRQHWTPALDLNQLRTALAFGLPLLVHGGAHWALAVSDRAILGAFAPGEDVGAYYAAFVLALPVSLIAVSVSQATQPLFVNAATSPDARRRLPKLISAHSLVVLWGATTTAVIGPPFAAMLLPPSYLSAGSFVPWLAIGAGLFGLYLAPMNLITLTSGTTSRVWAITAFAAIVNVALNLGMVPLIGALAAAVNTTIGYGILFVGVSLYARRVCHPAVPYEVNLLAMGSVMIVLPGVVTAVAVPAATWSGLAVRVLSMALVAAALLVVGPLRDAARGLARARHSAREGSRS